MKLTRKNKKKITMYKKSKKKSKKHKYYTRKYEKNYLKMKKSFINDNAITIIPTSGLCNYLRVIFSYYECAKKNNLKLNVIWYVTPQCNGKFLDYFESVPNINIMYGAPINTKIYYIGSSIHPVFKPNYSYLKLLPYMKELINARINILGKNYIAVHIRRTDHTELAKKNNKYTYDNEFINFIDKFNNKNLYIATDNKTTYDIFKKKYPNLVKFNYHEIDNNSLRQTSLKDAIIDIYMCVFSSNFMGSGWSSFSGLINNLRKHKK